MFLELPNVLSPGDVTRLRALAAAAKFSDGRASSPHSQVKNNVQIDYADPAYRESANLMAQALQRCESFRNFTFARIVAPPMLVKYALGMTYGVHSDAAFMPIGEQLLRSDLSCTLFISAPETYEGGELSITLGTAAVNFKGAAGSAVVYPSNTLHQVKPVTAGERIVGLTFIESMVPDPACRDMLYHLNEVAALEGFNMSWDNRTRLQYVRNNLRRMWGH
jgi:PKHD-type hydroxylase